MLTLLLLILWVRGGLGTLAILGSSYLFTDFHYPSSVNQGRAARGQYARKYGNFGEDLIALLGERNNGFFGHPRPYTRTKRFKPASSYYLSASDFPNTPSFHSSSTDSSSYSHPSTSSHPTSNTVNHPYYTVKPSSIQPSSQTYVKYLTSEDPGHTDWTYVDGGQGRSTSVPVDNGHDRSSYYSDSESNFSPSESVVYTKPGTEYRTTTYLL